MDHSETGDTGAYFCDSYDPETFAKQQPFSFRVPNLEESSPAAILLGWKLVSGTTSITFMTIIDSKIVVWQYVTITASLGASSRFLGFKIYATYKSPKLDLMVFLIEMKKRK